MMVAYSFKVRFAEPILAGTKDQTIREPRARPARPGEALQLYTGMRTRQCRLILRTTCVSVLPIRMHFGAGVEIELDGRHLPPQEADTFARRDGFADLDDMRAFWAAAYPGGTFAGVVIRWQPPMPEARS